VWLWLVQACRGMCASRSAHRRGCHWLKMYQRVHGHVREVTRERRNAVGFEDTPVVVEKVPPEHAMHTDEFEAPKATDTRETLGARLKPLVMC
jgi:hypothetical protein